MMMKAEFSLKREKPLVGWHEFMMTSSHTKRVSGFCSQLKISLTGIPNKPQQLTRLSSFIWRRVIAAGLLQLPFLWTQRGWRQGQSEISESSAALQGSVAWWENIPLLADLWNYASNSGAKVIRVTIRLRVLEAYSRNWLKGYNETKGWKRSPSWGVCSTLERKSGDWVINVQWVPISLSLVLKTVTGVNYDVFTLITWLLLKAFYVLPE